MTPSQVLGIVNFKSFAGYHSSLELVLNLVKKITTYSSPLRDFLFHQLKKHVKFGSLPCFGIFGLPPQNTNENMSITLDVDLDMGQM